MNGRFLVATKIALALVVSLDAAGRRPRSNSIYQSADSSTAALSGHGTTGEGEPDTRRDVLIAARSAPLAHALAAGVWINSEALDLKRLRGHVVVVDFWTFGCYNCRNTLPALKQLDDSYRERGLTIIGVHAPEFDREKQLENVRREVASLGIRYPVVTDNNYDTWRAYGVEAWPTVFILDRQGRIRFTHVGEGLYKEQERVIKKLLAEEYQDKSERVRATAGGGGGDRRRPHNNRPTP